MDQDDHNKTLKNFHENYKILQHRLKCEDYMNRMLQRLTEHSIPKGYKVFELTKLQGNCFFESLVDLGFGESIEHLREAISYILYEFRDYPGFFPNQPTETLRNLFVATNEIEVVYDVDKKKVLKYTYELMCRDLTSDGAWERLPTQLIMLLLSYLFDLKFVIFNSEHDNMLEVEYDPKEKKKITENETQSETEDTEKKTISEKEIVCLGHLSDCHYVPMVELDGELHETTRVPMYKNIDKEIDRLKQEYHDYMSEYKQKMQEEAEREAERYDVPDYTEFRSIGRGRREQRRHFANRGDVA